MCLSQKQNKQLAQLFAPLLLHEEGFGPDKLCIGVVLITMAGQLVTSCSSLSALVASAKKHESLRSAYHRSEYLGE